MKALIRITALIIAAVSFVSANAQDFEGVWYPLWNEGKFGSIKIQKNADGYSAQIKTRNGIEYLNGKIANGVLHLSCFDRVSYARYWVGTYNGEDNCIMSGDDNGNKGFNCYATNIYDSSYNSWSRYASINECYLKIKLVPRGENLALYYAYDDDYYVSFNNGKTKKLVFSSHDNWIKANTYTNW